MTSTNAIQRVKAWNEPFYFMHISGLPYLFFTRVPQDVTRAAWNLTGTTGKIIGTNTSANKIYYLEDGNWTEFSYSHGASIGTGIWGGPGGTLWAHNNQTDSNRRYLYFDGDETWTEYSCPAISTAYGPATIHGSATGAYVYSGSAYVHRYTAANGWEEVATGFDAQSIWCDPTGQYVFAAPSSGANTNTLYYSSDYGENWSNIYADIGADTGVWAGYIGSVWGFSATDVYINARVASGDGRIFRFDGSTWHTFAYDTDYTHNSSGFWGSSASELLSIGYNLNSHRRINQVNGSDIEWRYSVSNSASEVANVGRTIMGAGDEVVCALGGGGTEYIYRSTDGGATFALMSTSMPGYIKCLSIWNKPTWEETTVTDGAWTTTGFSQLTGLSVDITIDQDYDSIHGGVQDESSCELTIHQDESVLLPLFATAQDSLTNWARLSDNDLAANEELSPLTVSEEITGAPSSDGTIYLGNQTITYTAKSGNTFTGTTRGRYYTLDDDLEEVIWKPPIKWSTALNNPPKVTTFPRTMTGRVVSVWRNYIDTQTGIALPKTESKVVFRGVIDTFGLSDDGLGIKIDASSLCPALLNKLLLENQPSAPLNGFAFNQAYWENEIYIEEWVYSLDEKNFPLTEQAISGHHIAIEQLSSAETIDEVLQDINSAFYKARNEGKLELSWLARRGMDNKIEIGYHAQGAYVTRDGSTIDDYDMIPKGALRNDYPDGSTSSVCAVRGKMRLCPVLSAMGYGEFKGDNKDEWIEPGKPSTSAWKAQFALWTNSGGTGWDSWAGGATYSPFVILADEEANKAFFNQTEAPVIPIDVDGIVNPFVENLNDGSPFLVLVDDGIAYRAEAVEYANEEIWLKGAKYDWSHSPIGSYFKPDSDYYSVPESEQSIPEVKQIFKPSSAHYHQPEGASFKILTVGVPNTLLSAMLSSGTKDYNTTYDRWPSGWGLCLYSGFVDTESFERLLDQNVEACQRTTVFVEPTNFLDWLNEELQLLGACVRMVDGKITAIRTDKPTVQNVAGHIAETELLEDLPIWQSDPGGVVTDIKVKSDWDPIEDEYYRSQHFTNQSAKADNEGQGQLIDIESRGLRSKQFGAANNDAINEITILMIDRLYFLSQETYTLQCSFSRRHDTLTIGDAVLVTDSRIPNPRTGTRGITGHLGRVERITVNHGEGMCTATIRFYYPWTDNFQVSIDSLATPKPNIGCFAPAVAASGTGEANQVSVDLGALTPNNQTNPFSVGDNVMLKDNLGGSYQETTITAINGDTVTLGDNVTVSGDLVLTIASYPTVVENSNLCTELAGAYIGSTDGRLSATVTSVKKAYLLL